ncbi:ESPR-type extended signal peptide-containing protein [Megasphaera sp. WILCCON 0056]|uniref:ESPR-type extended signal peptide-containing protein n=1 Tax=Megasphaera sp. WILCCON 0056 TaxID=3345340 RepID=UPI003A7FAB2D
MNKIYKVIWNRAKQCYVVVSELAHSQRKTKYEKKSLSCSLATAVAVFLLTGGGQFLTVQAADTQINDSEYYTNGSDLHTKNSQTTNQTVTDPHHAIAVGDSTVATGTNAIAAGTHNTASGNSSIAFGGTYLPQTVRKHGTACYVYQIGDNTYYKYGNAYFSTTDDTQFTGDTSTAVAVMVNGGNTASGAASVAFGENTQAIGKGSVAFGMGTQAGDGNGGQNSVAFGNYTKALGGRSVAFGEYTVAKYNDSVAFGDDTRASSTGATAFGNRTRALAQYSTAWGNATVAADEESTAWGTDTIAGAKLDDNGAVTNIYTYKNNPDDKTEQPKTATEKMDVHGNLAYIQNGSTVGVKQMDIGGNTEKHDYVVLDGQDGNTYVRDYQGSLWRVKVSADGKTATVDTTVGTNGKVYNNSAKAGTVGSLAKTTINGVEVAITPDSVLKKAHEGSNGYNIDGYKDATAFGYSTEASGDYATAFGNDTKAQASAATAFGTTTTASGDNATAFGLSTTASGKQATAFGSSSTASGDNATAFGESSTASGEAATAFGISSTASGKNSLAALGGTVDETATNAAAIGNGAQATLANSVALGSNSKTTRAKYSALTDAKEKAAYAKGSTSTGSAWEATDNAIAVGDDSTTTRQITGVAAGSLDTDVVNVAQLRAVDEKHTIVTVGGQAVTADNTPVTGGNLDLKRTTAANGQETYDLSLDKNVTLGEQAETKGGKLTVNNVDKFENYDEKGNRLPDTTVKEAVKIDGKTVSIVKHDGSDADNDQRQVVLGVDQDAGGYVALYDNTGKKPTYIYNAITPGATYLKDGESYTAGNAKEYGRLEYGDYHQGTIQFIATLDDGQKYAGDNYKVAETETKTVDGKTTTVIKTDEQNVLLKKLNERLDIKGGATGALTENNIGVNVKDGVMKVQLAQNIDLGGSGSVKMGNTTINNGGVTITPTGVTDDNKMISLTDKGLSNGGKQITHVDSGLKDAKGNPVDLATASGDVLNNAVNVGDLQKVSSAHTAVTVNGSVDAPAAGADGNLGEYTDKEKGNLRLAQKKNTKTGQITYDLKLNDNIILGKDTSDGKDGQEGTIGLTGKDGVPGADGKQGYSTTIIKTEKGQPGANGKNGKPGVDGTDITRIVYQNGKDGEVGTTTHTVATLDDGLKFIGDKTDDTAIAKKLGEILTIKGDGTYDAATKTNTGNIQTSVDNGAIKVALNKDINLKQKGSLTVGGNTQDGSTTVQDPIIIKHFAAGDLTVTGKDKNGNTPQSKAGDYVTGLDNKDWDVDYPTYVSGRAATEDQLKKISDIIKSNAETAAGQHTEITVNDKKTPTIVTSDKVGTTDYGDYVGGNDNLLIAAKKDSMSNKMTYNIKLNDQLAIGQKGEPGVAGKDGKDGKVTVETSKDTTVVIGHDGEPGKDGKDGISVKGKDGKDGVTISAVNGKDGSEGHIGLTGPKGADGKNANIDISTVLGKATLDRDQNEVKDKDDSTKDQAARIQYQTTVTTEDGTQKTITHEVATMDDGLKIGANAASKEKSANPVNNKLNSILNIKGEDAKTGHTYTGDNLTTIVEQDANGNTTVKVLMDKDITGNSVTVGKDDKDGQEGSIGIAGKNGINGEDGKQGITTTIIKTEKGQNGKDGEVGKQGAPGIDGKDITRIVYQNDQNNNDQNEDGKHVVATLDDGLKFVGDDSTATPVAKKLNETLQIRGDGTYDATTKKSDGNIQTSVEDGTIKVALNKDINLKQDGSLTVGGEQKDSSTTSDDPIVIKHFDDQTLNVITGVDKDGKPIPANKKAAAGDYVTGLDNKDWNIDNPEYVSGRAATEDQLKKISDAVNNAATKAGQHTVVTVNDKDSSETIAAVGKNGQYGEYSKVDQGNLLIAAKDENGQTTYNIKLNDQLTIGQKGEPGVAGKDGKDGKITVETKGGTTVVIGHDGKDGEDGKDGLFVTGKDGKDGKSGVSIIGPDGKDGKDGVDGKVGIAGKDGKDAVSLAGKDGVGHIGLTGPKGEKGADGTPGRDGASIDISTDYGTKTLDSTKNVTVDNKEQSSRIIYNDTKGSHEVATMDDGLKFVGNDGKEVTKKLNSTLSLTGGLDKDAVAKASSKNLGVRQNATKDGLEIVMTDTPDFTKVTVGGDKKITIGGQPNSDTKNPANGNYIAGLDNTKWDKDHVTENRAATEGQLRDIAGSITNQNQGGGFALTSDEKGADKIVKQDLGKAIQVKGDTTYKADGSVEKAGNIKTSIDNGAIKVELNKNVDLTQEGSIKAGETTIDKNGVDTNKITIKDSTISISKDGINGGNKQITDVASGATEIIKGADGKDVYKYDKETNAANIGDVKRIAGDMKTEVNNNISNVNTKVDQIGQHVDNIQNDVTQLQQDVKADRTYQGDDGAAKKVNVKFGSFLSLTGGAKVADLTEEGNIGVVQKEIDDPDNEGKKITGLSVRLAKRLNLEKTTYTSNEKGQTYTSEIDGKGLTIKTGDANRTITVQDGNVNMGGNKIESVAPGKVAPDSADAVNGSQLFATNQTVANLGGAVNKLGTRVNRVGAGAAALAALHPLDFDPDDKWDFAAGYGNYKDASAVAVGAYYRPNEDTMFNIGGSFGGGENMVNAGISFKVGQGNHVSTSRVAMAKEIKDLRQDVANLNAIVNRQSALIDKLTGTHAGTVSDTGNDLFPDVPANHWAYEYVTKLKQAGILTGYPDGNFDGDRMMTRYEFAAIVYRAIMAGAASNPALSQDGTLDKLAKEFSPEMKHIRIDTIAKDKDGKPTIERVRVIPDAQS